MADTPPPQNTHKSLIATIIGAVMWILTGTGASIVAHFLPAPIVTILHALGELLAAIGAAVQVHQNTQATVQTTAAVQQVTAASVNLAPNPSIVAAQQRAAAAAPARAPGSPMQGS